MKTSLIAVALLAVLALVASRAITPSAQAAVNDVTIIQASVTSGSLATVNVDLSGTNEQITITASNADGDAAGLLVLLSCTPACPTDIGNPANTSVTVDTDAVTDIDLQLLVTCDAGGTVQVTADQGGVSDSDTVECLGAGGALGGTYQITATANPNLLPCEGGTSEIVADAYNVNGDLFEDPYFHFSTTGGLIEQTSANTADLTLGPGQTSAVVTVSIADPGDEDVKTGEVVVSLACNNFISVVVTANPNVIECGGTSVITATARDENGHVVPGVGFHFATSTGLLVVQPNHAGNEEAIAHLTLQPGMPDSQVTVSVGDVLGTVERNDITEKITVQNFCPGVVVGQNASAAPGQVLLNKSNDNLMCGEQIFIGMKIRDAKGQVPPDGTAVNLLTTSGLVEPTNTTTVNGTANVVYTAPGANGEVRITAAAGDAFGYTTLNVNCGPATGTGGIIPPNTGARITPPNTGDAGLK